LKSDFGAFSYGCNGKILFLVLEISFNLLEMAAIHKGLEKLLDMVINYQKS
jgi:hypothetical protein